MNDETKGMLYGVVAVTAFALTLPATRFIVPFLDPIFIGLGRAVIASIAAAMLLLWFRQVIPSKNQFLQLIIVALGVVIGFPLFSSWAMLYVPASHGGVVLGILPLATALVGVILGGERPGIWFWLVSFVGSGLVITYALLQGTDGIHPADIALLLAVVSAAIGYAVGAKLAKEMGGGQVICWALVIALPFILLPTIKYAPRSIADMSFLGFASFLYLALISQLFAFFIWYKGLALGGIARVSQTQLLQPFITLFAAILLLGETLDTLTVLFVFLVVVSVWLGKRMPIRYTIK